MAYMFRGTIDFNADLSRWDSSAVTTMTHSKWGEISLFLLYCLCLQIFIFFFFFSFFCC
jgi:surface protein